MLLLVLLDHQLRPAIKSITEDHACIISTEVLNDVVTSELSSKDVEYSDLIKIERDLSGKILAVNTDIKKVNLLKSIISEKVQKRISAIDIDKTEIPIGTLTGLEIFSGKGPSLKLKITMSGNIHTDLQSKFLSAGINQTKHQIYMNVSTKISALIPGYPVMTAIETNVLIAETVIVGEVPNIFADVNGQNLPTLGSTLSNHPK